MNASHFLAAALRHPEQHALRIERTGRDFVRSLEIAGDSTARKRGLLGRDWLEPSTGFLIAPTQGIHTFGMRFPIDVVGVSRDGRVVKIREHVPPRRLVFAFTAFAIIEIAAGGVQQSGLLLGDILSVTTSPNT